MGTTRASREGYLRGDARAFAFRTVDEQRVGRLNCARTVGGVREALPVGVLRDAGIEPRTRIGRGEVPVPVDDRTAVGGRSVPYRYASRTDIDGRVPEQTIKHLTAVLHSILPQVRDVPIAHGWCGVLAVPRDWEASIVLDKSSGLGWAGGYVGHGVTATNLAGRTLADLVLDQRTALTELPWVGHRSRNWEPEPLRWIGVRGMYLAYKAADWHESRGGQTTSPIAVIADKIAGRPH